MDYQSGGLDTMQGQSTLRSLALYAAVLLMGGLLTSCTTTPPPPPPPMEEVFIEEVEVIEVIEEVVPEMRTVYFDFDQSNIRADARSLLKANAEIIVANPQLGTITLQGNTDERGSEEYNLGLGERRANSVQRYLVDLGVPSSRLRTVSFGESKPAVMGHTESAWRWNRRVDFATPR